MQNREEDMVNIKAFQKYLCRNLNIDTIVHTLNLSIRYDLEFVKLHALKYIKDNQKEVAECNQFLKLFESQPELMQEIFIHISH